MQIHFSSDSYINSKWLLFGIPCANSGSHRTRQILKGQIKLIRHLSCPNGVVQDDKSMTQVHKKTEKKKRDNTTFKS